MIHIFKYLQIVPLFRNVSNEGLENTNTMFNESITLHRNVDNVLNFKLTDRDRRSIDIDNKNIKVKIIDDHTKLIVDTFYLSSTNNAKVFKADIPATFVNQLLPRRDYSFNATIEDSSGNEEPLYIDHDFMMRGNITVIDNYSEIVSKKYEDYSLRLDTFDREIEGEYFLEQYIDVNDDFIKMEFMTYDELVSDPVTIKIQKNRKRFFPIATDDEIQWLDHITIHNTHMHTWSNVELEEGRYRVVLITEVPQEYFVVYHYIQKL